MYGMPRIPNQGIEAPSKKSERTQEQLMEIDSDQEDTPVSQSEKGTPKPLFENEYLQQIGGMLDNCMQELQPYLQNDCNLAYMAKLTGIPAHHLAYYFREEKGQPFNDYRNGWRIRHAKGLIAEGKARELTLEAIGLLSGFSTRNTFYTAFKKVEGVSPSAYTSKE